MIWCMPEADDCVPGVSRHFATLFHLYRSCRTAYIRGPQAACGAGICSKRAVFLRSEAFVLRNPLGAKSLAVSVIGYLVPRTGSRQHPWPHKAC